MKTAMLVILVFSLIEIVNFEVLAATGSHGLIHANLSADWYLQNPADFRKDPIFFGDVLGRCENCSTTQFIDALKSLRQPRDESKKIDAIRAYSDAASSSSGFGGYREFSAADLKLLIGYLQDLKVSKSSRNYLALNSRLKEKLADAAVVEFTLFTWRNSRDQIEIKLRELSMNVSPSQFGKTVAALCDSCSGRDLVETFSEAASYNDQLDAMFSFMQAIQSGNRWYVFHEVDIDALESRVALIRNQLNQQVSPNEDRLRIQRAAERKQRFTLGTARKKLDERLNRVGNVLKNLRANFMTNYLPSHSGSEIAFHPSQNNQGRMDYDAFEPTKVFIPN